jgi:exodeoxyribonuclease-1
MAPTFLWYDLETFGATPRWDRIGQYAAIRTNMQLEEQGEPSLVYGRISPDYLPDPEACMLTGLTPQYTGARGVTEATLAERIFAEMSVPGTCVAGFNNLRFDDEFVRNLFYRNFLDPYVREYAEGNSRWDILDLLRMMHDLRPEGLTWVYDDDKPQFQLERLTEANNIEHADAHDALADVRATIALARRVREAQPRLYQYYFNLRKKEEVRRIVNLPNAEPILHTSRMYTRPGGCTSIVLPISAHPHIPNQIIIYDLRFDPEPWIDLEPAQIRERIFLSNEELGDTERAHFKALHLNKSPAIAPLSTLTDERARALGLDVEACRRRAERLQAEPRLVHKIWQVYAENDAPAYKDPDLQIYSGGFFGDADREIFDWIRNADPQELVHANPSFEDPRGPELLRRYLGRNYYDALTEQQKRRWKSFCAQRLLAPELDAALDYGRFRRKVENLLARTDTPAGKKRVLRDLLAYADWLRDHVLNAQ